MLNVKNWLTINNTAILIIKQEFVYHKKNISLNVFQWLEIQFYFKIKFYVCKIFLEVNFLDIYKGNLKEDFLDSNFLVSSL